MRTEHLILAFVIAVALFLVLREFACWYWKINTMVGLLKEIKDKLGSQQGASAVSLVKPAGQSISPLTGTEGKRKCSRCGEESSLDSKFCESCGNPF